MIAGECSPERPGSFLLVWSPTNMAQQPYWALTRALIGAPIPSMAGGLLSHCAINIGEDRRLSVRGSPWAALPTENPKPDLRRAQRSQWREVPSAATALHHLLPRRSPLLHQIYTTRRSPCADLHRWTSDGRLRIQLNCTDIQWWFAPRHSSLSS